VNHPALVKTSDQPSFSPANFSPFTSAEALRSSDISAVPSLNLKPNSRGGTAKKIISSSYKKIVEATQKDKIKRATKSKNPSAFVECSYRSFKEKEDKGLP